MVVEDQIRLDEPIFQLLPVFLRGGFEFFEERSTWIIYHSHLTLKSNILAVLEETVLDTGMIAVIHFQLPDVGKHNSNELGHEDVEKH